MARKLLNRKELREESDAAEAADTGKPKKAAKSATAKLRAPRKRSKKVAAEVRLKAFWGVFNQSLKRVALFEYSQRKQADRKAEELAEKQGTPHFVQTVKEVIEEA